MQQAIEWQRDIRGEEPELLDSKKPVGTSDAGYLAWSYKKGQQTRVLVLKSEDSQKHCFLDIAHGHQVSGIPRDAFRFLD